MYLLSELQTPRAGSFAFLSGQLWAELHRDRLAQDFSTGGAGFMSQLAGLEEPLTGPT